MIRHQPQFHIPEHEIEMHAIRSQGAGGQNVNKVSSAIHLRFDIHASSLPQIVKQRLINSRDRRLTQEGILIIKAQRYRDQAKNRSDALQRLHDFIRQNTQIPKARIATKPSKASQRRRMDSKKRRGQQKQLRGRVSFD